MQLAAARFGVLVACSSVALLGACRIEVATKASADAGPDGSASSAPGPGASSNDASGGGPGAGGGGGGGVEDAAVTSDAPPALGTSGCFAAGVKPPTVAPFGFAMPDLAAERAAYTRFGWHWAPGAEPDIPAEPSYSVADPDIHGDTEGDDLFTYFAQHVRTGQPGYLDRAKAWLRYGKDDLTQCVGDQYADLCYDEGAFGLDHAMGWGLVAWGLAKNDASAIAAAKRVADRVDVLWAAGSPFGCYPNSGCLHYGPRGPARHLLLVTRVAEATNETKYVALRDRIIDKFLSSPEWDETQGMYFLGDYVTDEYAGAGAYASGLRIQSSFQIGVMTEALDHAYRVTGKEEIRRRLVKMAAFVEKYGLDPTYEYTASTFGLKNGAVWHSYSAKAPVTFWDPAYTTSLVNTLMRGYRYTCEKHYADAAKRFFIRGNGAIYGEPTKRNVVAGEIDHFVDTRFDTSTGSFYLAFNKGELQYTYLVWDAP